MWQYIIKDDIIEYKKETSEVAARIIGETKDGIIEKMSKLCTTILIKKGIEDI